MRTVFCALATMEQLDTCRCCTSCKWFFVPISRWSWPLLASTSCRTVKISLKLALNFSILRLDWIPCFAVGCLLSIACFMWILILCWFGCSSIDLFWAWILYHVDLTVAVWLVSTSSVILLHLRQLVLDVIECKHVATCLIFRRRWMSKALACLRLWLNIHNFLLVDKLILICVRYI